jgi:DNA-binding response OmpR family regulator
MLNGRHILVVEDEALIALDVADELAMAGAVIVGPAGNALSAERLIRENRIDAAVLDYRLGRNGETSEPVARLLRELGVPFLFHTSSPEILRRKFPDVPVVSKPSLGRHLVPAVADLIRS